MEGYTIVVDEEFIDHAFGELSPYNLSRQYKDLGIGEEEKYDIAHCIREELKKGGPRYPGFVCVVGNVDSIFVAKIRISDGQKGKSGGYRSVTLVVPNSQQGFLIGITRHLRSSSDTNISDSEKEKLRKIVSTLESQK